MNVHQIYDLNTFQLACKCDGDPRNYEGSKTLTLREVFNYKGFFMSNVVNDLIRLVIMFKVFIVSKHIDTNPLFSSGKVPTGILQL